MCTANSQRPLEYRYCSNRSQPGGLMADQEIVFTGGQSIEMQFRAPSEGAYEYQVNCMSDCWFGCDRTIPLKFAVKNQSKGDQPVAEPIPTRAESGLRHSHPDGLGVCTSHCEQKSEYRFDIQMRTAAMTMSGETTLVMRMMRAPTKTTTKQGNWKLGLTRMRLRAIEELRTESNWH